MQWAANESIFVGLFIDLHVYMTISAIFLLISDVTSSNYIHEFIGITELFTMKKMKLQLLS